MNPGDPCERCGEPTSEIDVAEVGAGAGEHETMLVHASCMLPEEEIA